MFPRIIEISSKIHDVSLCNKYFFQKHNQNGTEPGDYLTEG